MPGNLEFDLRFNLPRKDRAAKRQEDPLRILVLGDFGGRGPREADDGGLGSRAPRTIDVDNFDDMLTRFAPRLDLPIGSIEIEDLDDFHPETLYDKLQVFKELRQTRRRLLDPSTFQEEAAKLRPESGTASATPEVESSESSRASTDSPASPGEESASTFERLLGGKPVSPRGAAQPAIDMSKFLENVVGPYVVPQADPRQDQFVSSVDQATSELMRSILHHREFRRLEATWRSVHRLITSLETGEELKIHLLDVTEAELVADLAASKGDLENLALYRVLIEKGIQTLGGEPWSLIVGDFEFGLEIDDLKRLAALGAIASQAGGPILATARPSLLGCRSLFDTPNPADWSPLDGDAASSWQALRESPIAPWIGLSVPRVLLRLPYGKGAEEIDRFDFEELNSPADHESYLWGNSAFAGAFLIGQAFVGRGWSMQPGDVLDVDDLPAHTYKEDGESKMKPCAEVTLTERAAEAILERGLMALVSYRGRNAARLLRFQSLASPAAALAGAWA